MKRLSDGLLIPQIGFGTVYFKGAAGVKIINNALNNGYRLIDSAYNYENEATVGRAIAQSPVPREDIIVTSKLPGRYHDYDKAIYTIQESLYRANLDYYDLYLIHWPNPKQDKYVEAWRALIDAQKWGLIRSIGVSNFLPEHIERLEKETGVRPSINQIEVHPYFNNMETVQWCLDNGIHVESWSPVGRKLADDLLENKELKTIGDKYNKTISQVILRWHIQLGSIPIPRSSSIQHQIENKSIFDFSLTKDDMQHINQLTRPDGRIANQDPDEYEEF
ncbi:2,5-diketo-D-gluconic acid reductase [Jeotgalibaca sp. PTS2502]|uniref:aldo/keto reductase n=1 Tax=Jeotgalibaca sp. PTS2502 TaxID=1903686 RepID=UPI000973DA38|nr:aldo/keto reductase [Jeotgalibaca sp. PTS2502]APZ48290.1 2,5-diketo-D-gluconic acid reductase [Jeotgalibaca sp. PTS2502]